MRLLGATAFMATLAATGCVRKQSSSSEESLVHDVLCPSGFVPLRMGIAGGMVCANESEVHGPFPQSMIEECLHYSGSTSAAKSACESPRWTRRFALDLRGTGRCPNGTQLDPAFNLCSESSEAVSRYVYGPFPASVVEKCKAYADDKEICGSLRWDRQLAASWLGVKAPSPAPSARAPRLRKFPWPEGVRPPQFVVLSVDGVGDPARLKELRDTARGTGSRFTYFLSGVYFIHGETSHNYNAPKAGRGVSDIGFNAGFEGRSAAEQIEKLVEEVNAAYQEGDEIATHFNGHFCGPGGVESWGVGEWKQEIEEFRKLVLNASRINGFERKTALGAADIRGARTPCLEGDRKSLNAALAQTGFSYDASATGPARSWPTKEQGIWRMELPTVRIAGTSTTSFASDFHFCHAHNRCEPINDSRTVKMLETRAYESLLAHYERNFSTNRAPFMFAFHSEKWHQGAYANALTRFSREVCRRPDTYCVTYQELIGFLDENAVRLTHELTAPPQEEEILAIPARPGSDRHKAHSPSE